METTRDSKRAGPFSERRRGPRYWLSTAVTVRLADGSTMPGLSVEISQGGMSAVASSGVLRVGETVELEPVAGGRASAVVRYKLGELYGFAFVELSVEQAQRIAESCEKLGIGMARVEKVDGKR